MPNTISPFFRSPFTDITGGMISEQLLGRCSNEEMALMDCMEGYGIELGRRKCTDYMDDFYECQKLIKQFSRFVVSLKIKLISK